LLDPPAPPAATQLSPADVEKRFREMMRPPETGLPSLPGLPPIK
jgi:hypothetical protein